MAGESAGTIAYMPPEQFETSATSAASDIYSVGMTAYSLLTGEIALGESGPEVEHGGDDQSHFEQPTIPLRQRAPHFLRRFAKSSIEP